MEYAEISRLASSQIPHRLHELPDAPEELYAQGNLSLLEEVGVHYLCVVGSRTYSAYGEAVCKELMSGLVGYPIVIISGLALGIDSIAHRYALRSNLESIAIPGSGLAPKVLYPASNRGLARDILESGGLLLSEFEPEQKAAPWTFPQRNRIMAGLSDAVLVIEAQEKSGTLITARLASEYNRDVLIVPGSIFDTQSAGPHMLMRLGATPIRTAGDILEHFGIETNEIQPALEIDVDNLSKDEQQIVELLKTESYEKSELINKLNIPITQIHVCLTSLELKGLIIEHMGKIQLKR